MTLEGKTLRINGKYLKKHKPMLPKIQIRKTVKELLNIFKKNAISGIEIHKWHYQEYKRAHFRKIKYYGTNQNITNSKMNILFEPLKVSLSFGEVDVSHLGSSSQSFDFHIHFDNVVNMLDNNFTLLVQFSKV